MGDTFSVGDIVHVNLDPVVGHEEAKTRPCVIVAIPTRHRNTSKDLGLAIIVPLTTKRRNWWTVVPVEMVRGLRSKSFALCHQIRTVSIQRISQKTPEPIVKKDLLKIRYTLYNILSLA